MKMSEKSYKKFTDFYKFTVEKASDEEVDFILSSVVKAAKEKKMESKEPLMCKENYNTIKTFFESFLASANDNDAIYLIESLVSISKFIIEHPDKVEKFVEEVKAKRYGKN